MSVVLPRGNSKLKCTQCLISHLEGIKLKWMKKLIGICRTSLKKWYFIQVTFICLTLLDKVRSCVCMFAAYTRVILKLFQCWEKKCINLELVYMSNEVYFPEKKAKHTAFLWIDAEATIFFFTAGICVVVLAHVHLVFPVFQDYQNNLQMLTLQWCSEAEIYCSLQVSLALCTELG